VRLSPRRLLSPVRPYLNPHSFLLLLTQIGTLPFGDRCRTFFPPFQAIFAPRGLCLRTPKVGSAFFTSFLRIRRSYLSPVPTFSLGLPLTAMRCGRAPSCPCRFFDLSFPFSRTSFSSLVLRRFLVDFPFSARVLCETWLSPPFILSRVRKINTCIQFFSILSFFSDNSHSRALDFPLRVRWSFCHSSSFPPISATHTDPSLVILLFFTA